jgi:hypothetical protein
LEDGSQEVHVGGQHPTREVDRIQAQDLPSEDEGASASCGEEGGHVDLQGTEVVVVVVVVAVAAVVA